jgi:hypothetical protein
MYVRKLASELCGMTELAKFGLRYTYKAVLDILTSTYGKTWIL